MTLKGGSIAEDFQKLVEDYVCTRYGEGGVLRRTTALKTRTIPVKPVA